MAPPAKFILTLLAAVLTAAWLSPCCCQTAWMAESAAELIAASAGGDAERCCCCCNSAPDQPRDCCPLGGAPCKQSGPKLTTPKPTIESPLAASAWFWAPRVIWVAPAPFAAMLPVPLSEHPAAPDLTLLGLGCALTV